MRDRREEATVAMNRKQIVAVLALLAIAALVAVLALRNPQPPILPPDEDHAVFDGAEACLVCHGASGGVPRSRNHPLGEDCTRCHGRR
jgi:hypothetical protein